MCKCLSEELPETLYHGTSSLKNEYISLKDIKKISISRGDPLTDFSQGFYLTSVYEQSLTYARRVAKRHNKISRGIKPIIIKYRLNIKTIKDFKGIILSVPDKKWAEFVYNNRIGDNRYIYSDFHNINKIYDYVYGHVADGKLSKIIEDCKEDCSQSVDMIESFREKIYPLFPYNNDQLSLHSECAVRCLEFLEVIEDDKYNPNYRSR